MVPYTMTSPNMKKSPCIPTNEESATPCGDLTVNPLSQIKICGKHKNFIFLIGPTSDILLGMTDSIIWLPTS